MCDLVIVGEKYLCFGQYVLFIATHTNHVAGDITFFCIVYEIVKRGFLIQR